MTLTIDDFIDNEILFFISEYFADKRQRRAILLKAQSLKETTRNRLETLRRPSTILVGAANDIVFVKDPSIRFSIHNFVPEGKKYIFWNFNPLGYYL